MRFVSAACKTKVMLDRKQKHYFDRDDWCAKRLFELAICNKHAKLWLKSSLLLRSVCIFANLFYTLRSQVVKMVVGLLALIK